MRRASMIVACASLILAGCIALIAGASPAKPQIAVASLARDALVLDVTPADGKSGPFAFTLYGPTGEKLASASGTQGGKPFRVRLSAPMDPARKALYALEWSLAGAPAQRRSLHFLAPVLETVVIGPREYLAGSTSVVRVIVKDRASGRALSGASVKAMLTTGKRQREVFAGTTDADGVALVTLDFAPKDAGSHRLEITADIRGQRDQINEQIRVKSGAKILLTTDKPLYQPGQTIHMRALTLVRPDMKCAADASITFEVDDSKGNKVFKATKQTDRFGTASADFVLASELNTGAYRVRAVVAGGKEEKTVTVDKYVLPKFKISVTTDRAFYAPGEKVTGDVQVDYFFGKPVAGATVSIECAKFDVTFDSFATIDGKTDDKGRFSWSVDLPRQFVGQPLLAGKALAKFAATVTDTADHAQETTKTVTVAKSPLVLAAVPESGALVPGLENRVYLVATYADGSPAPVTIDWSAGGQSGKNVRSDAGGFATIAFVPPAENSVRLQIDARDSKGNTAQGAFALSCDAPDTEDRVLMHVDKALFAVGDTVQAEVFATTATGTIYFDVVKDGQTTLTQSADLTDGKTSLAFQADAALAGTVTLSAYLIGRDGNIVRDQRIILVDPADDLRIHIVPAQDTYRPGEDAQVAVTTTDESGRGTPAAVVISVVDEAVFALQEMQPGLEKVFFYLEQEIAKPRYEIHGWDLPDVIRPIRKDESPDARERAATVLLAGAEGATRKPGIEVNTYVRDHKDQQYQRIVMEVLADNYRAIQKAMTKYARKLHSKGVQRRDKAYTLDDLVKARVLAKEELSDPWGGRVHLTEGRWNPETMVYYNFILVSDGPDLVPGTADDVRYGDWRLYRKFKGLGRDRGGVVMMQEGFAVDAAMPAAAPMQKMEHDTEGGGATGEEPRLRSYFPETLLWLPNLITDANGHANITIPLADSITTWRMTAMGNAQGGRLGSTTAPLRVFQDFFVDVDFPVALTQNDRVWVPVAIYNYLATEQTVRLVVQKEDWFELQGDAEKIVTMGPNQVKGVKFPIRVKGIGRHRFTVKAYGSKLSDAVARSVEVVPDGVEKLIALNGRLDGNVDATFTIPEGVIPGATRAHLKIYPGVFSQLVEGLDKILRMPGGCFEQTSSTTYPNVLVLDYMKSTGIVTPELQMKAEGFINQGYQRLLSFEVPGGGFSWFGDPPAHKILTAYGLMEFHDMSQVFNVDPAVISRTQAWLVSQQDADGSWKPSKGGIREGAINKYTDDVLRNTAYITLALLESGYAGDALSKAETYMMKHLADAKDNFTLALVVNAFAMISPEHKALAGLVETLLERRTEEDDVTYWKAQSETPTHGSGNVADIEVTSWAVMGLLRAKQSPAVVSKAITYLVKQKDAYGTWQSTQATIVALSAMIMAEKEGSQKADATITVTMGGKEVATIKITPETSDVMRIVDLTEHLTGGQNDCDIAFKGEGNLFYQVSVSYWLPHSQETRPRERPISIDVTYDRTQLAVNDTVTAEVTVENRTRRGMKMIIVDVGIPPAFTVLADGLDKLVAEKKIKKYSMTGRQIIFYLETLDPGEKRTLSYQLVARFPIKAKTPKSTAYLYYNPEERADADPGEMVVTEN